MSTPTICRQWSMAPVVFANAQGQNTVVPMGQTFSVFFYRSDIVKPEEVPKDAGTTRHGKQEAAGGRQGENSAMSEAWR